MTSQVTKKNELLEIMDEIDLREVIKCANPQLLRVYKKFLVLKCLYPDLLLVPTNEVDNIWHQHILDTRSYIATCDLLCGEYVHHKSGIVGVEMREGFARTRDLFQKEFGHPITIASSPSKCG